MWKPADLRAENPEHQYNRLTCDGWVSDPPEENGLIVNHRCTAAIIGTDNEQDARDHAREMGWTLATPIGDLCSSAACSELLAAMKAAQREARTN